MFFLKENQKVERQDETERKTEKGKRKTERTAAAVNELYPQKGKKKEKAREKQIVLLSRCNDILSIRI